MSQTIGPCIWICLKFQVLQQFFFRENITLCWLYSLRTLSSQSILNLCKAWPCPTSIFSSQFLHLLWCFWLKCYLFTSGLGIGLSCSHVWSPMCLHAHITNLSFFLRCCLDKRSFPAAVEPISSNPSRTGHKAATSYYLRGKGDRAWYWSWEYRIALIHKLRLPLVIPEFQSKD